MKITGLKNSVKVVGELARQNSPSILTGLSVAGLVATTVMAVKATPKALSILFEKEIIDPYGEFYTPLDKKTFKIIVKSTWKVYAPAAGMGAFTIFCIIGSNSINLRRNAALVSMYSLTEATLKEYQAKVVETIGEKKEKAVRASVAEDKVKNNPISNNEIIITGKGDHLCYDVVSGRYFKSDIEKLRKLQNDINQSLISDMWITLNEVYSKMNLSHIAIGDDMGWNVDKLVSFEFSSALAENGEPCIVLDHKNMPFSTFR